jgi:hypothetical protein
MQTKFRFGVVDRIHSDGSAILKDIFKKETDLSRFLQVPLIFENGSHGVLVSRFGQTGKAKATVSGVQPLPGQKVCALLIKYAFSNKRV